MRLFNGLKISVSIGLLAVLTACGTSPGSSDADIELRAAACDTPLDAAKSGVAATVGGDYHYYVGDARYTASGERRSLAVENFHNHLAGWKLNHFSPQVGSYRCSDNEAPFISLNTGNRMLDSALGDCEVTVAEVNGQGMLGRFSATLRNVEGSVTHQVTDGCFTVVFTDAILDADLDGLSDADDGCPFDAANDCAEQPANINVCHMDDAL